MNVKNELLLRLYVVMLFFILAAGVIGYQLVKISVIEGDKWRKKGTDDYRKYRPIEAERGTIFSADGTPLAVSQPFFDIAVDPCQSKPNDFKANVDSLAYFLARYFQKGKTPQSIASSLKKMRAEGKRYFLVERGATFNDLEKAQSLPLLKLGRYGGGLLYDVQHNNRMRPYKSLAARTIGVYRENNPVGIEKSFDAFLTGESGKKLWQKLNDGDWVPVNDMEAIAPKRGDDVYTTIDVEIQDFAEKTLLQTVTKYQAAYGTIIVMEVKTGAIRAIANLGKSSDGYDEIYNYAVGTAQEPGSTMKLATAMALLEDHGADLNTPVRLDGGKTQFYGEWMYDSHQHGIQTATMMDAFAASSNIGMARLADQFYNNKDRSEQFINRLQQFGLNARTNIEIPGEVSPFIKNAFDYEAGWSKTSIPWMAHGYELKVTPLQMLTFYNAVANKGIKMQPYLVSRIEDEHGLVKSFGPKAFKQPIASLVTIDKAHKLLEEVMRTGTGKDLQSNLVQMAAKTGTSKVGYFHKGQSPDYIASIAGFFPSDDPVYSCIVVIGQPKGAYYGSSVAGPAFKAIAEKCYLRRIAPGDVVNTGNMPSSTQITLPRSSVGFKEDYKDILKTLALEYQDETSSDWILLEGGRVPMEMKRRFVDFEKVPDVIGMGARDASYLMERCGLRVRIEGAGKVVQQSLRPGLTARGQMVQLKLG